MTTTPTHPSATQTAGTQVTQALNSAESAARQAAHAAADHVDHGVQAMAHEVGPALIGMADRVVRLSHQGVDAVQRSGQQLGDSMQQANDRTVSYIRQEPVKSVLMAAAFGATAATVVHWLTRSRH